MKWHSPENARMQLLHQKGPSMDDFVQAHRKIWMDTTLESLKKHGFGAGFFASREAVCQYIMDIAKDCRTVGIGGTHTVRALGIVRLPRESGQNSLRPLAIEARDSRGVRMPPKSNESRPLPVFSERANYDWGDRQPRRRRQQNKLDDIRPAKGCISGWTEQDRSRSRRCRRKDRRDRCPYTCHESQQKNALCAHRTLHGLRFSAKNMPHNKYYPPSAHLYKDHCVHPG